MLSLFIITLLAVMAVDTLRTNGVVIPKYNNIKKGKDLFDEVTSIKLPANLFAETSNGCKLTVLSVIMNI